MEDSNVVPFFVDVFKVVAGGFVGDFVDGAGDEDA